MTSTYAHSSFINLPMHACTRVHISIWCTRSLAVIEEDCTRLIEHFDGLRSANSIHPLLYVFHRGLACTYVIPIHTYIYRHILSYIAL